MNEITARMMTVPSATANAALRAGFVALLLSLLILTACASSGDEAPQTETDADGLPVAYVAARYATGYAADLATLVTSTDASFVGEVVGTSGQRELEFQDTGHSVPITTYVVRVEESDGDPAVGSTVEVEQMGGVVPGHDGNVRVVLDLDSPMYVGDRYLFIANENGGTYTASAFARFPIEDGHVAAPAAWEETGASQELAGATVDQAMGKVAAVGH